MKRVNYATGNGQYRIVGDHLGSTTVIVDSASTPSVVHRQYHKPYGEVAWESPSGGSLTTFGYTGQRLDKESGLMYYGARFYDPVLAHFVSADPTVPEASNPIDYARYLYVRANPLRYLDPSGYGPEDYYVLVYGCTDPRNPNECAADHGFGEYTKEFLYSEYKKWQAQYRRRYGEDVLPSWEDWSKEHIRTVAAPNNWEGAHNLDRELKSIPGTGSIHILSHSEGGGAVIYYLYSRMYAEKLGVQDMLIDSRIESVAFIDSNLDPISDLYSPYASGKDLLSWLERKTRIKPGAVLQVNVPNSFVHSRCIGGSTDCRVGIYSRWQEDPSLSMDPGPDWFGNPARQAWHGMVIVIEPSMELTIKTGSIGTGDKGQVTLLT